MSIDIEGERTTQVRWADLRVGDRWVADDGGIREIVAIHPTPLSGGGRRLWVVYLQNGWRLSDLHTDDVAVTVITPGREPDIGQGDRRIPA